MASRVELFDNTEENCISSAVQNEDIANDVLNAKRRRRRENLKNALIIATGRNQDVESENSDLEKQLENYEQSLQKKGNETADTKFKQYDEEKKKYPESQDTVTTNSKQIMSKENKSESEIDGILTNLRKNMAQIERAFERQKSEEKQKLNVYSSEITQLKKQLEYLHNEKDELQRMFINNLKTLTTEKETSEKQRKDAEENFRIEKMIMREQGDVLMAEKQSLEIRVQQLDEDKNALLLRLSQIAAIADLSYLNRPKKVGEAYSELYDNEWTDAFEVLTDVGHEEESAIETLRLTLEDSVKFCENTVDKYCEKASDAMNLIFHEYVHSEEFKKLKPRLTEKEERGADNFDMVPGRKRQASVKSCKTKTMAKAEICAMIPVAREEYDDANWISGCIRELKPYLLKCLNIGWMMVVQSPPMVLHKCPSDQEIRFDKHLYKEYTSTGPVVSFVVWPALLLHEKGPAVNKGVAEGKKPNK